ncbi:MAG: hypothetical protein AB7S38_33205 [Vulcanimicrobiota bacterium]
MPTLEKAAPSAPRTHVKVKTDKDNPKPKSSASNSSGNAGTAGNAGPATQTRPKDTATVSDEARADDNEEGASGGLLGGLAGAFKNVEDEETRRDRDAVRYLDEHFDAYDNPGGGDTDGVVSVDDLQDVASGDFDQDKARERLQAAGVAEEDLDAELARLQENAEYLLGRDELLDEIDVANDPGGDHDDKIARSDLHHYQYREQLESVEDGYRPYNVDRTGIPETPYSLPTEEDDGGRRHSEPNRTDEVIRQQENAILEGLTHGGPVEFTNSNGETENLTIEQVTNSKGDVEFRLRGEDGHTINVSSELTADETRTALARVADYYTQVPDGLRESVDNIEFLKDPDPDGTAAASFNSEHDRVRFFGGLDYINEAVFEHEFGHGVGYETDGEGEGFLNDLNPFDGGGAGSPQGWEDAINSDGNRPTDYANTNHKEDFAESWAIYLEAREQGDDALEEFAQQYPHRFDILDEIYENAA